MFAQTSNWANVARHFDVFVATTGMIVDLSDTELARVAADLASRNIGWAVVIQSIAMPDGATCGQQEGYGTVLQSYVIIKRLLAVNVTPRYLVMDAPVYFGHYDTGSTACGFSVSDVAAHVHDSVNPYLGVFPDIKVLETEPFPVVSRQSDWKTTLNAFAAAFQSDLGFPIYGLQADTDWRAPDGMSALTAARAFAQSIGGRFGVIYNSDRRDSIATDWVESASTNAERAESLLGFLPDQAVIETWDPVPATVMPDSDPASLGHVAANYDLGRPRLTGRRSNGKVTGRLLSASGAALPGVTVSAQPIGSTTAAAPPLRTLTGVVPAGSAYVVAGLRVNTECSCAGQNNLLVGDFTYAETGAGTRTGKASLVTMALAQGGSPFAGNATIAQAPAAAGNAAIVTADASQSLNANVGVFQVTPGANFTFSAGFGSLTGGGLYGSVIFVWLDASYGLVSKLDILMPEDLGAATKATTTSSGSFSLADPGTSSRSVRISIARTPTTRGGFLTLK